MARRHYWQFLVTDEGNPIENADISIYIANTETPAYVFTGEVGDNGINVAPQIRTSRKGYFEFWVADNTEENGYFYSQKFKIAWEAPGVAKGYVDFVDVFSTSVAEVDETSTDPTRNKAVSNLLAKGWQDHMSLVLYENGLTSVHGIIAVDESAWDDSVSDNTKFNKLVNNILVNDWVTHSNTIYDNDTDSWVYTLDGGLNYLPVLPAVDGAPGRPHGIDFVDTASTDTEKNKLISNALSKQWHDHRVNTALDEHTQYSLVNGTRNYTAGVGYSNSTIVDSVGDDDFITKIYVDGKKYYGTISSYTSNSDGTYTYTVTHNLNVIHPIIAVWEDNSIVTPISINYLDLNSISIVMETITTLNVRVLG
jgi:hypothetical protein